MHIAECTLNSQFPLRQGPPRLLFTTPITRESNSTIKLLPQILHLQILHFHLLFQLLHHRLVRRHHLPHRRHPTTSPPPLPLPFPTPAPSEPLPQHGELPELRHHRHISSPHPLRVPRRMRLLKPHISPLHRRHGFEHLLHQPLHLFYFQSLQRPHRSLFLVLLLLLMLLILFFLVLLVPVLLRVVGRVVVLLAGCCGGQGVEEAGGCDPLDQIGEIRDLSRHGCTLDAFLFAFDRDATENEREVKLRNGGKEVNASGTHIPV